ncbi:MAG TPA: SRPBCC family protein, partial [bacterium]|nr:SRPBCC family protein [bacterium]
MSRTPTWPASNYVDPAVLDRERALVFPHHWQLAARQGQLEGPNTYCATEVAGEPVVVTRDAVGTLHALSNVCRHRAGPVSTGCGARKSLTCAYHGWTYSLDGHLLRWPEIELAANELPGLSLPTYEVAEWEGLIFVRLGPGGPSLAEWLGEMAAEVPAYGIGSMRFERRMAYDLACNWKVYAENFLEPYHLPLVHPELTAQTDYANYRVELRAWHSRQFGPTKPGGATAAAGDSGAAWYFLFPNVILNCSFGLASTNLIVPTGSTTCRVICDFFVRPDADLSATEAGIAFSDRVQQEDIGICEAVQRGLQSRS